MPAFFVPEITGYQCRTVEKGIISKQPNVAACYDRHKTAAIKESTYDEQSDFRSENFEKVQRIFV